MRSCRNIRERFARFGAFEAFEALQCNSHLKYLKYFKYFNCSFGSVRVVRFGCSWRFGSWRFGSVQAVPVRLTATSELFLFSNRGVRTIANPGEC